MDPVYQFDVEVFRAIHLGWNSAWLDALFLFFSYVGLGQVQGLIAVALLFRKETRYFCLPLIYTVLFSGFVAQLGKFLLDRERPSRMLISVPQEGHVANSFPSGHTTSSFAFAVVLILITHGTPKAKWGWIALGAAFMVGLSRIYRGVHWPSDAIAGALFGVFSGVAIYWLLHSLGHFLHLEEPEATLTGREAAEAEA